MILKDASLSADFEVVGRNVACAWRLRSQQNSPKSFLFGQKFIHVESSVSLGTLSIVSRHLWHFSQSLPDIMISYAAGGGRLHQFS